MADRVLVCGAGVIGSVYAVRLARAGFDVTVMARGDRLEAIRREGVRIRHALLRDEEIARVRLLQGPDASQRYDLALVAVRAGQIEPALRDVVRSGGIRAVVVVGNNLAGHAAQAEIAGRDRFVLGFGSFGGYRDQGAVVYLDGRTSRHPDAERRSPTTLGVLSPDAEAALALVEEYLSRAGLPTRRSPDMVAWLVCHGALIFPLAGAMYAAGGDQQRFCRTRDAVVLGVRACKELLRALAKLGVALEPGSLRSLIRAPEPLLVSMLQRRLAGEVARVAMFGHANAPGGRNEIAGGARELDAVARKAGLLLPAWECLVPFFDPVGHMPPLPDGARTLRLRLW